MPTSPTDARGPEAGMTLLEVLAAVTVAMLLMLALPGLGGGPGGHERALRMVSGTLSEARAEAIASRHPVRVIFDLDTRRIERRAEPAGAAAPPEPASAPLPEGVDLFAETAAAVAAGPARPAILFLPDGSTSGGRVTLVTGERRDTLLVRWLTGAVRRVEGAEAS